MSINSKISIFDTYVHVDYSGEYENQSANDSIDEVVKLCKSKKYTKVLFDFRKIKGDVSTLERFKMAQHLKWLSISLLLSLRKYVLFVLRLNNKLSQ